MTFDPAVLSRVKHFASERIIATLFGGSRTVPREKGKLSTRGSFSFRKGKWLFQRVSVKNDLFDSRRRSSYGTIVQALKKQAKTLLYILLPTNSSKQISFLIIRVISRANVLMHVLRCCSFQRKIKIWFRERVKIFISRCIYFSLRHGFFLLKILRSKQINFRRL